jgi:hypothetical protein
MIAKLMKTAAYMKAPRATFAMMHPLKAARYGAIYVAMRALMKGRR